VQQYFRLTGVDSQKMAEVYAGRPKICRDAVQLTNLSRIFLAILIIKCAAIMLSGTYIMDAWAKAFTIPLLFFCICLLMGVCYLLENGKNLAGRLLLIFVIGASCVVSVIFCGGFVDSQFTPILLFPIILAFCTLSILYSIITISTIVIIPLAVDLTAKSMDFKLPDFTSSNDPLIAQINLMVTLFACVFFCLSYLNRTHETSDNTSTQG
jgi:hypothetical protein